MGFGLLCHKPQTPKLVGLGVSGLSFEAQVCVTGTVVRKDNIGSERGGLRNFRHALEYGEGYLALGSYGCHLRWIGF